MRELSTRPQLRPRPKGINLLLAAITLQVMIGPLLVVMLVLMLTVERASMWRWLLMSFLLQQLWITGTYVASFMGIVQGRRWAWSFLLGVCLTWVPCALALGLVAFANLLAVPGTRSSTVWGVALFGLLTVTGAALSANVFRNADWFGLAHGTEWMVMREEGWWALFLGFLFSGAPLIALLLGGIPGWK